MAETVDKHIDDSNIDINIDKNIDCNMVFDFELDLCFILYDFVELCSFTCHYSQLKQNVFNLRLKSLQFVKRSILSFYDSFFLSR